MFLEIARTFPGPLRIGLPEITANIQKHPVHSADTLRQQYPQRIGRQLALGNSRNADRSRTGLTRAPFSPNQPACQSGEPRNQRKQQHRIDRIEQRMEKRESYGLGNGRRQRRNPARPGDQVRYAERKPRQQRQSPQHAEQIDQKMGKGRPARIGRRDDRSQIGRRRRTHVLAQHHGQRVLERNQSAAAQYDRESGHSARRLHESRQQSAGQSEQQSRPRTPAAQSGQPVGHGRTTGQRGHVAAENPDREQQQRQAAEHTPRIPRALPPQRRHPESGNQQSHGDRRRIESEPQ